MNFLDEFIFGPEHKSLSRKVHARLIHNSCLPYSQMTNNTWKVNTYPNQDLGPICEWLMNESFTEKNLASGGRGVTGAPYGYKQELLYAWMSRTFLMFL